MSHAIGPVGNPTRKRRESMEHKHPINVLVVDDDIPTCQFMADVLRREHYEVSTANSGDEAIKLMQSTSFPIILSDIHLGDPNGMELLSYIKKADPLAVVIFVTGYGSVDTAVRAIQLGAFDYLSKPINLADMEGELKALMYRASRHIESNRTKPMDNPLANLSISMIGKSAQMVKIYRIVAKAAMTDSNVLVIGESGTGKELVARAIHDNSSRASHPFVTVNCCALSEGLLESELFGHVRGSFTGAIANKRGLFEEADGGTIFLDEIGDISPALQVKLLRVLQEGEFKPVGAIENRKVNVRVIAATHRNLDAFVKEGRFREDLYYRLKVILVETPPLRERADDLEELIHHFIRRSSQTSTKRVDGVSPEALQALMSYSWPGNIRELENAIERAVAMTNTTTLFPEDFPEEIVSVEKIVTLAPVSMTPSPEGVAIGNATADAEPQSLEELERTHIIKILERVKFNKSRAANILGIDRVTLYRKASRYGIQMRSRG